MDRLRRHNGAARCCPNIEFAAEKFWKAAYGTTGSHHSGVVRVVLLGFRLLEAGQPVGALLLAQLARLWRFTICPRVTLGYL